MSNGPKQNNDTDAISRAMREMLLEAPAAEFDALARELGLDTRDLSNTGRSVVSAAIAQHKQGRAKEANVILLHKGLNSLLIMLRRRDNLDETELALKANVDESEIRRIEFDSSYLPNPRTIYNLEKTFSLPSGVLAKLSGAIVHHSPVMEERVSEFAANAKSMGKLSKEEKQLLNAFVKFLTEQI
jgi:transcriptional regulator with XRE-family HTH domain